MKKLISLFTLFCFVFGSLNLMAYTNDEKESASATDPAKAREDILMYLTESKKMIDNKSDQELKEETQRSIDGINEMSAQGKITKTQADRMISELQTTLNSDSIKDSLASKLDTSINKIQTLDAEMALSALWVIGLIPLLASFAGVGWAFKTGNVKLGLTSAALGACVGGAIVLMAFIA